jgi:3-hydroxy-9,10-secoandrosta-1,3,5(10)-triene-9,17-dione monooxygenase reductase component
MTTAVISPADYRAVLGHFASGVIVVTGQHNDRPAGLTCQSFFSLSLTPPLIAIAVSAASASWPTIERSGAFCANVLTADQADVCRSFAQSGSDKFKGIAWARGATGSPRLAMSHAWIDCSIQAVQPTGDHLLAIGVVRDIASGIGSPLLFYRGELGVLHDMAQLTRKAGKSQP